MDRNNSYSNDNELYASPQELVGGGEHFDDAKITPFGFRMDVYRNAEILPRETLHDIVAEKKLQKPRPRR